MTVFFLIYDGISCSDNDQDKCLRWESVNGKIWPSQNERRQGEDKNILCRRSAMSRQGEQKSGGRRKNGMKEHELLGKREVKQLGEKWKKNELSFFFLKKENRVRKEMYY